MEINSTRWILSLFLTATSFSHFSNWVPIEQIDFSDMKSTESRAVLKITNAINNTYSLHDDWNSLNIT